MKFANTTAHEGSGSIDNSDSITTRFSVRVVDVLPNGNLIIQGIRQATYGGETQTVILRGAVRPLDIEADNTVYSYLLADLNIRYQSSGVISNAKNSQEAWSFFEKFFKTCLETDPVSRGSVTEVLEILQELKKRV